MLAIPRGGVVVGAEVALVLGAPLDVIVPRKLRSPDNPELAVGAVAHDGTVSLDPSLGEEPSGDPRYLEQEIRRQMEEITRRMIIYRGRGDYPAMEGRAVVVVDDGIATGSTMVAATRAVRKMRPRRVIAAVPVAPAEGVRRMEREADAVVCLYVPTVFYAVGQFYEDFAQTTDDEVVTLLREASRRMGLTPLEGYTSGDVGP